MPGMLDCEKDVSDYPAATSQHRDPQAPSRLSSGAIVSGACTSLQHEASKPSGIHVVPGMPSNPNTMDSFVARSRVMTATGPYWKRALMRVGSRMTVRDA